MDKPTLQEVKEYFKNANDVKSLENNEIFEIDFESLNENINKGCDNYWCQSINESLVLLWSYSQKKYAEIISYKEPLYQLTAKEIKHAYENPQYLKDTFKECFETELEVGKWYKSDYPLLLFITEIRHHELVAYGFNAKGEYKQGSFCTRSNVKNKVDYDAFNFEPATEKEVEEALIKEARKRYNKNDSIQSLWKTKIGNIDLGFKNEFNLDKNEFWYGGYLVFKDGTWAEIITPTYTIQEAESKYNIKIKAV